MAGDDRRADHRDNHRDHPDHSVQYKQLVYPLTVETHFVILFPFLIVMMFRKDYFSIIYALAFICSMLGGYTTDYIIGYDGSNIASYIASWFIIVILYLSMIISLLHVFLSKNFGSIHLDKTSK